VSAFKFAEGTSVSVVKSQGEISAMLSRAGAHPVGFQFHDDHAVVAFTLTTGARPLPDRKTHVMMRLTLPARAQFAKRKKRGYDVACTADEQAKLWEQACRERWRGLALTLKAKLVSVDAGIETVEEAFLAHMVVNDGGKSKRFSEVIINQMIAHQNSGGRLMLGAGS